MLHKPFAPNVALVWNWKSLQKGPGTANFAYGCSYKLAIALSAESMLDEVVMVRLLSRSYITLV